VCPLTGLRVPKNPDRNLQWRANLLAAAADDKGLQRDLYTASSLSMLFWINTFAFTYRKFYTTSEGLVRQITDPSMMHVPYVTWEIQDEHLLEIERAIDHGFDLLTDKSRDMGATWDHITPFHHQWLFRQDRNFLEISRKENAVDTLGKPGEAGSDPGTLFGKHDYLNRWLPSWMLPRYSRKRMSLMNLQNHSRIDGESSNASAGSSDRRTAILLDEMAKMAEGESIKRSTKDVTACRLANSTPNGAGTAFSKWRNSGQVKVFPLMYWDHPEKGRGRTVEPNTRYPGIGPWLVRTPWFTQQEAERSPKEMAIEVLADHIGSGDTFFEASSIEMHRQLFVKTSSVKSRWTVDFRQDVTTEAAKRVIARSQLPFITAKRSAKGPLRSWVHLPGGRLDQTKNYVMGIDISKGQGASNSIVSIMCAETLEKVAEWADANTPPYELARIACALAIWVGGSRMNGRPLMIWEANGPGWDFGRQVVKEYQYPAYYLDHQIETAREKRGKKYGWHSSRPKKEIMLGRLRRAYAHNGFINHSGEALDEALVYVYFEGGGIGPAELMKESEEAKKCHGDRVIADGLCLEAVAEVPKGKAKQLAAPARSMEGRRRAREKARNQARKNETFDFR